MTEGREGQGLSSQFVELLLLIHSSFYRQTQLPLPLNQFAVLVVLRNERELSLSAIAENLCVSKQQMTAIVDKLRAAGYVEKRRDLSDRRCSIVTLTPKGSAVLNEQDEKVKARFTERLAGLSAAQIESFRQSLETVSGTIETMFYGSAISSKSSGT